MRAGRRLHSPWLSPPTTEEAFDTLLKRRRGEDSELLIARRSEDGKIVGYFDISQIIRGPLQGLSSPAGAPPPTPAAGT